jgi:hypothetical protein
MLRYFFRKWTNIEFVAALATLLAFVLSAVPGFSSDPRIPIRVILISAGFASLFWLVFLATRKAFVIVGYRNVMSFLELLARHARFRVWTARTHTGRGVGERVYFGILAERLSRQDSPLEDVRRLLRLAPAAREHIDNLIADFLYKDAAEVRCFSGIGPQFDFMITDDVAVIGFPMAGGTDNVAAVVLRQTGVVEAVANVFNELWNDPSTRILFRGSATFPESDRQALLSFIEHSIAALPNGPSDPQLAADR